jgi:hypothetical protein
VAFLLGALGCLYSLEEAVEQNHQLLIQFELGGRADLSLLLEEGQGTYGHQGMRVVAEQNSIPWTI